MNHPFFHRSLTHILQQEAFSGKILFIVGPRQVGKTTLTHILTENSPAKEVLRFDGDYLDDRSLLQFASRESMDKILSPYRHIVIDEGQKIPNIGTSLKMMIDEYKKTKNIIVTGSSSLHLLDQTSEPLTGRKRVHEIFPFSWGEITQTIGEPSAQKRLEEFLLFGTYPEVLSAVSEGEKIAQLREITSGQLYRDILEFQTIKNPAILQKLLELLALQIGQEVSYHELANILGINQVTVEKYIDLLEKSFVIFRLRPFFTNKRKEVTKMKKIYFYDLGIRNTLLRAFTPLSLRTDTGALFENFFILEKKKQLSYTQSLHELRFWRTQNQQEIDLIEVAQKPARAYEVKWKNQKYTPPLEWSKTYSDTLPILISKNNFWEYL